MRLPTFKRDTAAIRREVTEQTAKAAAALASLQTDRHRALLDEAGSWRLSDQLTRRLPLKKRR